jgi:hypothetical protein
MRSYTAAEVDGRKVLFEVDDVGTAVGPERVSRHGDTVVADLSESLDDALDQVRPAAMKVLDAFRALRPDGLEIEFGLRLDAAVGAVIAKASAGAHFTVKLTWAESEHAPGS